MKPPSSLSRREKLLLGLLTSTLLFSFSFSYGAVNQNKVDAIMKMITDAGAKFSDIPVSGQSKSERTQYYEKVDAGLGDAVEMLAVVRNNIRSLMGLSPAYTADEIVGGIVGGIIGGGTVGGGNSGSGTTRVCKMVKDPPNPNAPFTCQGLSGAKTFSSVIELTADKDFHKGAAAYIDGKMIKSGFGPGMSCTQTRGEREECTLAGGTGGVTPTPITGDSCPTIPTNAIKAGTYSSDYPRTWHGVPVKNGINYWEIQPGGWMRSDPETGASSDGVTLQIAQSMLVNKRTPDGKQAPGTDWSGFYTCDGKDTSKCSIIGRMYITKCPGYVSKNPLSDPRVALYFDFDMAYTNYTAHLRPVSKTTKVISKKAEYSVRAPIDLPGLDEGIPWYIVIDQKYSEMLGEYRDFPDAGAVKSWVIARNGWNEKLY